MSDYVILTDSSADLPASVQTEPAVPFRVFLNGKEEDPGMDRKLFFDRLRAGDTASTSAPNYGDFVSLTEPYLQSGRDVVFFAFSSALSSGYQTASLAAAELAERYPERSVRVIDTRCASLGQGLFVLLALQKQKEGLSFDELCAWAEETGPHLCHWFTVDDLLFLKRGGRISSATAVVGTMLGVKPILHVDDEGRLVGVSKARGRKGALLALTEKVKETALRPETQTMAICHGDCVEDAEFVAEKLKSELGVPEVVIGPIGTVIGAHTGAGALGVFFLGTQR